MPINMEYIYVRLKDLEVGFGEFWLQSNNGKKINLNFQGKLHRSDFVGNEKLLAIFDFYDKDGNGVIESDSLKGNEFAEIFGYLKATAELREGENSGDQVIDNVEAFSLTQFVKEFNGVGSSDIFEFLELLEEKKDIVAKSDFYTSNDGTLTVVNHYSSGGEETVVYDKDGNIRIKYREKLLSKDFSGIEPEKDENGNLVYVKYEDDEHKKKTVLTVVKDSNMIEIKPQAQEYMRDKYGIVASYGVFQDDKLIYFDEKNKPIAYFTYEVTPEVREELRGFVGENLDNNEYIYNLLKGLGWLDELGIKMQNIAVADNLSDAIYNGLIRFSGVEELNEYVQEAVQNAKDGKYLKTMAADSEKEGNFGLPRFNRKYTEMTGKTSLDFKNAEQLRLTTIKYEEVKALIQRIEYLNEGLKEVKRLYKNADAYNRGVPNSDRLDRNYDGELVKVLKTFFGDNEDITKSFIVSISEDIDSKESLLENFPKVLERIEKSIQETLSNTLNGETTEELTARYQKEYKAVYGKEDVIPKIEDLAMSGQELGSFIQLGLMSTASIILGALTGGTGSVVLNALIGFVESVGTDYALSLSNALTSREGLTWEKHNEILERTKGTATFIGFGMVAANPFSRMVGKLVSKAVLPEGEKLIGGIFTKGAVKGAVRETSGTITRTTITGEQALQYMAVKSSEFFSEVGAFTGFELASNDEEFLKAFGGQTNMLGKIKIMNAAIQTLLGSFLKNRAIIMGKKHAVKEYTKMLESYGIKDAKITEYKSPSGSKYTVIADGRTMTFNSIEEMGTGLTILMALKHAQIKPVSEGIKNKSTKELTEDYKRLMEKEDITPEDAEAILDTFNELTNRGRVDENGNVAGVDDIKVEETQTQAAEKEPENEPEIQQPVQEFTIRELSDAEFEEYKAQLQKKVNKLPKEEREGNVEYYMTKLTKENIQIIGRILSMDAPDEKLSYYSNALSSTKNINNARMFEFVLDNREGFGSTELWRIDSELVRAAKTSEDLELRIQLCKAAMENQRLGNSSHIENIILKSKSVNEAMQLFEYTDRYGISPKQRENLNEKYGEEKANHIIESFVKAKDEFGLNVDDLTDFRDNGQYIYAKSNGKAYKDKLSFFFDGETGELLSFKDEDNIVYNLQENKIVRTIPIKVVKKDSGAVINENMLMSGITETTDLEGNWLGSVEFVKSKIKGQFEIYEYDKNGKRYKVGLAEFDKKGGKHIEKHVESLDGTKTDCVYADDKLGNRYYHYSITDADGKVLYKSDKIFKVIDENHFISTDDGVSYDIQYTDTEVTITKLNELGNKTDEKIIYTIKDYDKSDYDNFEKIGNSIQFHHHDELVNDKNAVRKLLKENFALDEHTIDRKLIPALKQLSGQEWFELDRIKTESLRLGNMKDNAHSMKGAVEVSKDIKDKASVVEHEIGHEKYAAWDYENDEEFMAVYSEEKSRAEAFLSEIELEQMDYFIKKHMSDPPNETAAEANEIVNIPNEWGTIGSRTMFLMRYFPKTIAYVANKNKAMFESSSREVQEQVHAPRPYQAPAMQTFESLSDFLNKSESIDKKFSVVQVEQIKVVLQKNPERLEEFNVLMSTQGLDEAAIIRLLTSEKVTKEEILNIKEYKRIADENGFDLIQMLESDRADFDNYVREENARLTHGQRLENHSEKFEVTDNLEYLKEQVRKHSSRPVENCGDWYLSALENKKQVRLASEILASVENVDSVSCDELCRLVKEITEDDLPVVKKWAQAYGLYYKRDILSLLEQTRKNPVKEQFALDMLELKIQHKDLVKQDSNYGSNYVHGISREYSMLSMVKLIKTPEQEEAVMHVINSLPFNQVESRLEERGSMLAIYVNNMDDAQDYLNFAVNQGAAAIRIYFESFPHELRECFYNIKSHIYTGSTTIQTFSDIAKKYGNETTSYQTAEFLKNNKDIDFLNKWEKLVKEEENQLNVARILERAAILDVTGVEFDHETIDAIKAYKTDGVSSFAFFYTEETELKNIAEALKREDVKSLLGRTLTYEEARKLYYVSDNKLQMDFVLSHLNKELTYSQVSTLLNRARDIINENQLPLVELLLDKNSYVKIGDSSEWNRGFHVNELCRNLTTKEAVEKFIELYDTFPIEDKNITEYIYNAIYNGNGYFLRKMTLLDRCQSLTSVAKEFAFRTMTTAGTKGQEEAIIAISNLLTDYPELAQAFKYYNENQLLQDFDDPEAANRIRMKARFFEHVKQTEPENFQYINQDIAEILQSKEKIDEMIRKYDYLCSIFPREQRFKPNPDNIPFQVQDSDGQFNIAFRQGYFWKMIASEMPLKYLKEKFEQDKNNGDNDPSIVFYNVLYDVEELSGDSHAFLQRLKNNTNFSTLQIEKIQGLLNSSFDKECQPIRLQIAQILCFEESDRFSADQIIRILDSTKQDSAQFTLKMIKDRSLCIEPDDIVEILDNYNQQNNGKLAIKLCFDKKLNFPKGYIASILQNTLWYNIDFTLWLCTDKELNFPKEHIAKIVLCVRNGNTDFAKRLCTDKELNYPPEMIAGAIHHANEKNMPLVERLCTDKELNFPKDKIEAIIGQTNEDNLALATELCTNKELNFPIDEIWRALSYARGYRIPLATRLCTDKELNFPKDRIPDVLQNTTEDNLPLVGQMIVTKGLLIDRYADIISSTKIHDDGDLGGNNGKTDPKKIDKYIRLLQNPRASEWVVKMVNNGWDIETVSKLNPTKQGFYSEKAETKPQTKPVDSDTQFFMDFGLDEKHASAIVKAITKNGAVDITLQQAGVKLINAGISSDRIGDVLTFAQFTGEFNQAIIDDAILIKELDLSQFVDTSLNEKEVKKQLNVIGFAEKYLPLLNNIEGTDIAVKFNAKLRNQLKGMLTGLKPEVKQALASKGFDLDVITKKLDTQVVKSSDRVPANGGKGQVTNSEFRKKSSITGFEKIVVDKYEPVETVWRSESECKKWAQDKYDAIKRMAVPENEADFAFNSTRTGDHVDTEEINRQRKAGLKEWFEYFESEESGIQDNPFAKLLLAESITENLLPENSETPKPFNKDDVKKTLAEVAETGTWSFDKSYKAKMNAAAKQSSGAQEVEIGGRKMTWYTVPKTDSSHPDFKTNAAKVRAFSDGTNWCIRTWNAEPYVQQGNMHFLVDETGLTQVCIRENSQGNIAEIQKRQQVLKDRVPVPYADFVHDYVTKKGLSGCEGEIQSALDKKPQFDAVKNELQKLASEGNYKAIFEKMEIKVTEHADGTWEISHYSSYFNGIALTDYGIKENDLLANVTVIKGDADFKDSNVTSLPNLRHVGGKLNFRYAEISNLRNLEEINGKKIDWGKEPDPEPSPENDNNSGPALPQGSADNGLLNQARGQNPVRTAENKVFQQWVLDGLERTPSKDIMSSDKLIEVSELIFSGKIGKTIKEKFEEEQAIVSEFMQIYRDDIQSVADRSGDKTKEFAIGVVNILGQKLGFTDLTLPKVKVVDDISGAVFNWIDGTILISSKITDKNQVVALISHEMIHLLQYRGILREFGEIGLVEMISQNKNIAPEDKEALISKVTSSGFNSWLLESVKDENYSVIHTESPALNTYLNRIYKNEFTNNASDKDTHSYMSQLTEQQAYRYGSEPGRRLRVKPNLKTLTETDIQDLKQQYPDLKETHDGVFFVINEDGTVTQIGKRQPKTLEQTVAGIKDADSFKAFALSIYPEIADVLQIKHLMRLYEQYGDAVTELVGMKEQDLYHAETPKFDADQIIHIAKTYAANREILKPLLEAVAINKETGKGTAPRYDGAEAVSLINLYEEHGQTVIELAKRNEQKKLSVQDLNFNETEVHIPRFSVDEIKTILEQKKYYNDVLEYVDRTKKSEYSGELRPYSAREIVTAAQLNSFDNEMSAFFRNPNYIEKIKQNSAGKYQKELLDLFAPGKIRLELMQRLILSGMSETEFLSSLRKFAKSTYKLAYETPNQYLSYIHDEYSTPVNGKFPELPQEELAIERRRIDVFFDKNMAKICRALQYIDSDTLNHFMDKRTENFEKELQRINQLEDKDLVLLSRLLQCKSEQSGKGLSPKEKMEMTHIVEIFGQAGIDKTILQNAAKSGLVNVENIKQILQEMVYEEAGINLNDISPSIKKFNKDYLYLSLFNIADNPELDDIKTTMKSAAHEMKVNQNSRQLAIDGIELQLKTINENNIQIPEEQNKVLHEYLNMLKNIDNYTEKQLFECAIKSINAMYNEHVKTDEIYTVIKEATLGNFNEFITDSSNKYGQANLKTKEIFAEEGLNYEKWDELNIPDMSYKIGKKQVTVRLWSRNPQEDLFIGNKTTCCTGIGQGNAAATPGFLLNKAYNVVQMLDSNGNVVCMARVFMGKFDGEPHLVIDTIEMNKTFIKGMSDNQKAKIRDGFFEYINQYSLQVTGDARDVYFNTQFAHVPVKDLVSVKKEVGFVGEIAEDEIYINTAVGSNQAIQGWLNPKDLPTIGERGFVVVPRSITMPKSEPKAETKKLQDNKTNTPAGLPRGEIDPFNSADINILKEDHEVTVYEASCVYGQYKPEAAEFVERLQRAGVSLAAAKNVVPVLFRYDSTCQEFKEVVFEQLSNQFKSNSEDLGMMLNNLQFNTGLKPSEPASAKVLQHIFDLIEEGKLSPKDVDFSCSNIFSSAGYKMFSNAEEIMDVYAENKDCLPILIALSRAHAQKTEFDTDAARKLCEAARKIGYDTLPNLRPEGKQERFNQFLTKIKDVIPYGKHEIFMDFLSKADIEKYPNEIKALLEKTDSYNRFEWNTDNKQEDINFALELAKIAKELNPEESSIYPTWTFVKHTSAIKTQEARDFSIKFVKEVKGCYSQPDVIEALNERPDIYPQVLKYMEQICHNSTNGTLSVLSLLKSDLTQEQKDFFMEKDSGSYKGRFEYGNFINAVVKNPEFLEFVKENFAERGVLNFKGLNETIYNFGLENLDVIRYLLSAKDSYGEFKYDDYDFACMRFNVDELPKLDLEQVKLLAELETSDGKKVFDTVSSVLKALIHYPEDVQILLKNEPPSRYLDSYTLYERTFKLMQNEVSKYGVKTFKEFEELVPTLKGNDRADAGKLLGKIKKQTIDTFLNSLPSEAIFYLCGRTGNFTAKDLDNAIQRMNNNPVLRKYLDGIEETGWVNLHKNKEVQNFFDENEITAIIDGKNFYVKFTPLEKVFLADDRILLDITEDGRFELDVAPELITNEEEQLVPANPNFIPEAKKMYCDVKDLYNLLIQRYAARLSKEQLEECHGNVEAYIDTNDYKLRAVGCIEDLSQAAENIGMGKVSALVHNETPMKCMEYIDKINRIFQTMAIDMPGVRENLDIVLKNPKLKDNDFKAVVSSLQGLNEAEKFQLFADVLNKLASSESIDANSVTKIVYGVIKEQCGLEPEVTDVEVEGWDVDYLPYILNAIQSVSAQPGGELNAVWLQQLVRTAGDRGKYEEFLFNPETENGRLNLETKSIYESKHLNFDQFMNFKGKVEFDFAAKSLDMEPLQKSIVEDLTNMKNEPSIKALFEEFAKTERLVFEPSGKITLNGKDITEQADLLNFITKINKFISDNSKVISQTSIADVKDHFAARKSQVSHSISDSQNSGIMTITLWQRDVKHDLFQGHYCQCCVSLDGCNNHSIIQSLSHTVDQIAELKTADGTTVGKVKMLFLEDTKTGEPILLANGFEIVPPYSMNDAVREQFVNFMREYSKAVCGKEVPIYTGMTYQKINYEELPDVEGNFQLLGKTPNNTYHLDSYNYSDVPSSHPIDLDKPHDMQLKVLFRPKNSSTEGDEGDFKHAKPVKDENAPDSKRIPDNVPVAKVIRDEFQGAKSTFYDDVASRLNKKQQTMPDWSELNNHNKPATKEQIAHARMSYRLNVLKESHVVEDDNAVKNNNEMSTEELKSAIREGVLSHQEKADDTHINLIISKCEDNPLKLKNMKKLIDAGYPTGVCMDIAKYLDIPENILDNLMGKVSKFEDKFGYGLYSILLQLHGQNGLKEDYQETLNLVNYLINKKESENINISVRDIADIVRYANNTQKADLFIKYMKIPGSKSLKPDVIEALSVHFDLFDSNVESKIKYILKLTPEQAEIAKDTTIDGLFIKTILKENYTNEQIDMIKEVLYDKAFAGTFSYHAIDIVMGLDCNKELINMFKVLYSADLHPKSHFDRKKLDPMIVKMIVDTYRDENIIKTIKYLIENGATKYVGHSKLKEQNFVDGSIKKDDLVRMGEYLELIKNNQDLKSHLSFDFVRDAETFEFVKNLIIQNKEITYQDIKPQLEERALETKKEKYREEAKNIKDPYLQTLAVEMQALKRGYMDIISVMEEISYKLDGVNDRFVNSEIKKLLDECAYNVRRRNKDFEYYDNVNRINMYLDTYHTLNSDYEYIGTRSDLTPKREYFNYVAEHNGDKDINGKFTRSAQERFNSAIDTEIAEDFEMESRIERLKNYAKDFPNDKVVSYFYKEYYLKLLPEDVQQICAEISDKYNVKLFSSAEGKEMAKETLQFVESELAEWVRASNGQAKFPPVIDLTSINKDYVNETSAYGQGAAAGLADSNRIAINGFSNIVYAIRHELTHYNEVYNEGINDYDTNEIMPHKIEDGIDVPDYENCKFKEEFLNAGISPRHIKYAYNNTREFIAVASEGDMSKYSEDFKKMLIAFGLPKWELDMKVLNPAIAFRSDVVNYLVDFAEKNLSIVEEGGDAVDMIRNNSKAVAILLEIYSRCAEITKLVSMELRRHNIPNEPKRLFEYVIYKENRDEILSDMSLVEKILKGEVKD